MLLNLDADVKDRVLSLHALSKLLSNACTICDDAMRHHNILVWRSEQFDAALTRIAQLTTVDVLYLLP